MFGSDAKEPDDGRSRREAMLRGHEREERRVAAWIGASLVIEGDLRSSEDMTIAGRVEGNVSVPKHTLVVAPGARIRGDIVARTAVIHGDVVGQVNATRKAELGETGSVEGDIHAPAMEVAEGATLDGRLQVAATRSGRS